MRGQRPKDPAVRRRANKVAGASKLAERPKAKRAWPPGLPKRHETVVAPSGQVQRIEREWSELTRAWWADVWTSPMAAKYLEADAHGLFRLAALIDDFWADPKPTLAAEIRHEQAMYGLTPLDRMRLQWEVERVEAKAQEKAPAKAARQTAENPRLYLVDTPAKAARAK